MMNGLKNKIIRRLFLFIVFTPLLCSFAKAQTCVVFGTVNDENNQPLEFVNVVLDDGISGTTTDATGYYTIPLKGKKHVTITASYMGYKDEVKTVSLENIDRKRVDFVLLPSSTDLSTVVIEDNLVRSTSFSRIDPKAAQLLPSVSNDIGALIKTLPGVASSNELSSQYSVRGGNFDENIVYVNGIEVFRPFLTRSGQQEGLSFVNSDLVSSISFSAGGFEARYGDKMSSVLDITYKKPTEFHASASLSLLSASANVEGKAGNFTYLAGFRQKTNTYLLGGMDTKGTYKPSFSDFQSLLSYSFNKKWELSLLANYSRNLYRFVPETRETKYGGLMEAYSLTVYMDGFEDDIFNSGLGALSLNYKPNDKTNISITASAYQSIEQENYDILGQYYISLLENNIGSDNVGNVAERMGEGAYLSHARNKYTSNIYIADLKGSSQVENHNIQWGLQYRFDDIFDVLNRWEYNDSAGFSVPTTPDSIGYTVPELQPDFTFELYSQAKATNYLQSNKMSAYLQDSWLIEGDNADFYIIYGLRSSYYDVNNELTFSPRLTFSVNPKWKYDMLFKFSTGYYNQTPSYREMRDENGILHTDIKSQISIHFVAALDWNLYIWNRPFKFIAETYYKYLDNLIPYTIDNVMIQYYPQQTTQGCAAGIDMKLTGELVRGVDSWISLSIMKTEERYKGGEYFPRPTDQLVNFSIFLQDYIPNYPQFKMQLNLTIGSGLPVTTMTSPVIRYPMYRRVDIGFSWQVVSDVVKSKWNFLNNFQDVALTFEILNLLDIQNTISYTWVTDVSGIKHGVPNYLTRIMPNFKLSVKY